MNLIYTNLFQLNSETSILCFGKSSSNPLLEPNNSEQCGSCFILKQTTSAFDGAFVIPDMLHRYCLLVCII